MISVVVNTSCLGPRAAATLGSAGRPHAARVEHMRKLILPRLREEFDQVIVAGEFEPGDGYEYVSSPSRFFNCRDVLAQRQAGFAAAEHNLIVFQMDDHLVPEGFAKQLTAHAPDWDVLSPVRLSGRSGVVLNSGWNDVRPQFQGSPYLHTHVIAMTRRAVTTCPWSGLPPVYEFDVVHTRQFRRAGLKVEIADDLKVFDLEE